MQLIEDITKNVCRNSKHINCWCSDLIFVLEAASLNEAFCPSIKWGMSKARQNIGKHIRCIQDKFAYISERESQVWYPRNKWHQGTSTCTTSLSASTIQKGHHGVFMKPIWSLVYLYCAELHPGADATMRKIGVMVINSFLMRRYWVYRKIICSPGSFQRIFC